jgi:Tol biopolymer transport system component
MKKCIALTLSVLSLTVVLGAVAIADETPTDLSQAQAPLGADAVPPAPTAIPYPTISPDYERNFQVMNTRGLSGRIAFSASVDGLDRIFVLDLNSGRVRKLIEGPGHNSYPTWSHDGRKLAFMGDRDRNKDIYIANWDGTNEQRLTSDPAADENPTWTPDDKQVVFDSEASGGRNESSNIFMVSIQPGSTPVQITNLKGKNTIARVSPDGKNIAYSTNRFWPGWDVCMWNLVTKQESCPLQGKLSYCRAAWSPSGKYFAYSTGILNSIDIGYTIEGQKEQKLLTELPGKEYDATWSPSESLILFASEADERGNFNLYTVDMQRKVNPILKSSYSLRYPTWTGVKTFELEAERLREVDAQQQREADDARAAAQATAAATVSPAPVATQ